MKVLLKLEKDLEAKALMRKFGYIQIYDRKSGKTSFVRRLRKEHYPRFNAYLFRDERGYVFDIHYDWRRPMHKKEARSSEQDTDIVREEVKRVGTIVWQINSGEIEPPTKKKGFWSGLFGGMGKN